MPPLAVTTPHGPARVHLHSAEAPAGALILGHGAGGGVSAPDLLAAMRAALAEGMTVALVEQPYRVAGRRTPPAAPRLDAAWTAVVERLRAEEVRGLPIVVGGRSSGARVACRTADAVGAVGVLCLAFPLQPPGRDAVSRLPELDRVRVPVLIVQGERDAYGMPPAAPERTIVAVPGDHALRAGVAAVGEAVRPWLRSLATATAAAGARSVTARRPA